MTISKLSQAFEFKDIQKLPIENPHPVFDKMGYFEGVVYEEGKHQWSFIPVGSQVWYDEESDTIATLDTTRQLITQPISNMAGLSG